VTLAYLLRYLPTLSETFVYDELDALSRAGAPPAVWALDPGPPGPVHPGLEGLLARARYIPRGHAAPVLLQANAARSGPIRAAWEGWGGRPKDLRRALWLGEALARDGVTGLHVHFAAEMAEVAWAVWRARGIGYSLTVHARDLYRPRPSLEQVLADARAVVTISSANRERLAELGVDTDRLHRVRQGIPIPPPPAPRRAPPAGRLRLVSVGRLVPKKGHDLLIHALAELVRGGVDATLVVAGDGPERAALEALVAERSLADRVELLGGVPRDRIEALLAGGCDLFALACRVLDDGDRDGIPVALMEAMARGVPVVSTAVSGVPELVEDGHTGLLVPPDDPGALAAAIARLAADEPLRASLAVAARARVERDHTLDRQVQRLRTVLAAAHGAPVDNPGSAPDG